MKKRSINGNHINMIKGRWEEAIDPPPHHHHAASTQNMLMNAAKVEAELHWEWAGLQSRQMMTSWRKSNVS